MTVSLQLMSVLALENLAHGAIDGLPVDQTDTFGLPPAHVVQRSLALFSSGIAGQWCFPYLVMSASHACMVGSCGFKGPPERGEVEIGYGIAPSYQRQGLATKAIDVLVNIAFSDGAVKSVLATISPGNAASIRVAEKLGFAKQEEIVDVDGEPLTCWRRFC